MRQSINLPHLYVPVMNTCEFYLVEIGHYNCSLGLDTICGLPYPMRLTLFGLYGRSQIGNIKDGR